MRRAGLFVVLLLVAAVGSWWYFSHRTAPASAELLAVYYAKVDGNALGTWTVSLRSPQPGESAMEHLHNTVLYAAVQAVAGPPSEVSAVRFPPGTHVNAVSVTGSTAVVDLSHQVTEQVGGSLGENGEFKELVYTVTGVSGIDAVQVTVDGQKLATLPGGHVELDEPLHRSDF